MKSKRTERKEQTKAKFLYFECWKCIEDFVFPWLQNNADDPMSNAIKWEIQNKNQALGFKSEHKMLHQLLRYNHRPLVGCWVSCPMFVSWGRGGEVGEWEPHLSPLDPSPSDFCHLCHLCHTQLPMQTCNEKHSHSPIISQIQFINSW